MLGALAVGPSLSRTNVESRLRTNTSVLPWHEGVFVRIFGFAAQVRYYPDTYHGFAVRGDVRNPGMEGAKEEVRAP